MAYVNITFSNGIVGIVLIEIALLVHTLLPIAFSFQEFRLRKSADDQQYYQYILRHFVTELIQQNSRFV